MATQEVTRDLPPRPQAPVDETVVIPAAVKRAGAAADALHTQVYQPEPPAEPPAPPQPEPPPAEPPVAAAPPAEPPPPPQPEPPAGEPEAPTPDQIRADPWANRYNAMKGRYDQSQRTITDMQQMLTDLGDELVRTQQMIRSPEPAAPAAPATPKRLITTEDEQTYGTEFIDLARRAGLEAVQGELGELRGQQVELQKRLRSATRQTIGQYLDSQVPAWKQVMASPRWKAWLRLPDVYSGRVRKGLLDAAYQAADAPRVAMFFKGFLNEERAAGHIADPAPPQPEPPAPAPVPREPAVPLATLAAPGRATRPAPGTQPETPADKPIFTRKQIADFYTAVRQGRYNGRETEKVQHEQQIFAAQREGRVR